MEPHEDDRDDRTYFVPCALAGLVVARFGSSGIRGPLAQVTPELMLRLGQAVGEVHARVVLGRDGRLSGPLLQAAFTAGALSGGARVHDAGMLPTPALAFATRRFDVGAVLTASHNPAPDNGLKLWTPRGMALPTDERRRIEERLAAPATPRLDQHGDWQLHASAPEPGVIEAHAAAIRAQVRLSRPLTVVVDAGNGVGALETPRMLREMGCKVITLNAAVDGTFPGRPSEPSAENLGVLCAAVRDLRADVGLAHDGDADRIAAVDERGRTIGGDALLALLARQQGAKRIVVPVDTSLAVPRSVPEAEVVYTKVGDAFVSEAIVREGADFGGEPSGAIIFPSLSLCPDGPHGAARVAALAAQGSLAAMVDALPRFPVLRASIPLGGVDRDRAMNAIALGLRKLGEPDTLDGVRVQLADGWVLVRPSGTEPKLRITAEAEREPHARELLEKAVALVKEALR